MNDYAQKLLDLLFYSAAVTVLVAGMIILSYVLGERHRGRSASEPYESGIVSTGSARLRFPARFYIIAMFFVIFDLETVFLTAWAISIREAGWSGFAVVMVFIAFLVAVLLYVARSGAFSYVTSGREILKVLHRAKGERP